MDSNRRALAVYLAVNIESQQSGQPHPVARTIPLVSLLPLLALAAYLLALLGRVRAAWTGLAADLRAGLGAVVDDVVVVIKMFAIGLNVTRFAVMGV